MADDPRDEPDPREPGSPGEPHHAPRPPRRPDGTRDGGPFGLVLALVGLVGLSLAGFAVLVTTLLDGSPDAAEEAAASTTVGASSDGYDVWARNEDGTPVRWDPCQPLEIVVNDDGAPAGWRHDLSRAVDEVAEHTGMDVEVAGTTDERPTARRDAYQPERYGERWAPVLVAWADPGEDGLPLLRTDRGIAIPVAVGVEGDRTYVTGQVVLNRQRVDLQVGFDDRATSWGATLLHEFGHLLGLAHVDDRREIMARHPGDGPVRFGPGDRDGLRAVGRDQGCRDPLTPQPVDVPDPTTELDLLREHRRSGD
jgi:hypothetical protein